MDGLETLVVTGRYQPFHNGHLQLVRFALAHAERVIVGVTNAHSGECVAHTASAHRHLASANPHSFSQRREMISAALSAARVPPSRVSVVAFPLETPAAWPATMPLLAVQLVRVFSAWEREKVRRFEEAGVRVWVLHGEPASRISASDIRLAFANHQPWEHWVPAGTREWLREWHAAHAVAGAAHG
jgi:cytidyltransferase-like protein